MTCRPAPPWVHLTVSMRRCGNTTPSAHTRHHRVALNKLGAGGVRTPRCDPRPHKRSSYLRPGDVRRRAAFSKPRQCGGARVATAVFGNTRRFQNGWASKEQFIRCCFKRGFGKYWGLVRFKACASLRETHEENSACHHRARRRHGHRLRRRNRLDRQCRGWRVR